MLSRGVRVGLARAQLVRSNGVLRQHTAIEGEGEGGEGGAGDDGYHTTVRISRREQGRCKRQRAEMPVVVVVVEEVVVVEGGGGRGGGY